MDLTETMEELYSLLLIIGHVIADEGEGETPLVCGLHFHLLYNSHTTVWYCISFFFCLAGGGG